MTRRSHHVGQLRTAPQTVPVDGGHRDKRDGRQPANNCWPRRQTSSTSCRGIFREAANSRKSAPATNWPGLPEMMINPAKSSAQFQVRPVPPTISAITDRDKYVRALAWLIQREQDDIRLRKRSLNRGRRCHEKRLPKVLRWARGWSVGQAGNPPSFFNSNSPALFVHRCDRFQAEARLPATAGWAGCPPASQMDGWRSHASGAMLGSLGDE